jgi:hypothetical protein
MHVLSCLLLQMQTWDRKVVALQNQVTDLTRVIAVKEHEIATNIQSISSLQDKNCQLNNEVGFVKLFALFFIGRII